MSGSSEMVNSDVSVTTYRALAWANIAVLVGYLVNNVLSAWFGWPGAIYDISILSMVQTSFYLIAILLALTYVVKTSSRSLRDDSETIYDISKFIIRAAFWAVFLVGLIDLTISFMKVEGFLVPIFGEELASDLGRKEFRGLYIHTPFILVGLLIALLHKGLGFPWLALLVVIAELLIVITRFIFSYEQAFMADLVRFWYAALFLFASAYTLYEEGHVRVDVLFASLSDKAKGLINSVGSILLGISLCWVIIVYGMWNKSSIINTAIISFEITQSDVGMFVKYWMAGFLAIFAITMLVQFSGYFLEGLADYRNDPGKRKIKSEHTDAT